MRDIDLAYHPRMFAQHQRARLVLGRDHIAVHLPVDAHPAAESQVALDGRSRADQRIDAALRLAVLFTEHKSSLCQVSAKTRQRSASLSARSRLARISALVYFPAVHPAAIG